MHTWNYCWLLLQRLVEQTHRMRGAKRSAISGIPWRMAALIFAIAACGAQSWQPDGFSGRRAPDLGAAGDNLLERALWFYAISIGIVGFIALLCLVSMAWPERRASEHRKPKDSVLLPGITTRKTEQQRGSQAS